jgi:hypothetical protein
MASVDWKKILCPIDFSDASRAALETAAELAKRYGATVALFHAYPVPGYTFPDGSFVASSKMLDELSGQANLHMAEWKSWPRAWGSARSRWPPPSASRPTRSWSSPGPRRSTW